MRTPEINELLRLIAEKYTKPLHTSTDYEEFSYYLKKNGFGQVSVSTLKRLWGYVNEERVPRRATLDTLAAYIGHETFDAFVNWLKTSTMYNSSFFMAHNVASDELPVGAEVEISWLPNRRVALEYLGASRYRVVRAENSKLQAGDSFVAGCIIEGTPLYVPYLERGGERTAPFIAGRNGGISSVAVKLKNV